MREAEDIDAFGASHLSTLVQPVANRLGHTLMPEMSLDVGARNPAIRLLRFEEPEPQRVIGLAWHETSARVRDHKEIATFIADAVPKTRRLKFRAKTSGDGRLK